MWTQLPPKVVHIPIFCPCLLSPNGWMDQDATWYGVENPGPGDVVLDWVAAHPLPPIKGAQSTVFGSCLLWPNGWMDEGITWYRSRPRPRPHCIRRGPSSPRKGHISPLFSAHVYCGHGRPSQLLLSSCTNGRPKKSNFTVYGRHCMQCPLRIFYSAPVNISSVIGYVGKGRFVEFSVNSPCAGRLNPPVNAYG